MKSASQGQGAPGGDHLEIGRQQIKPFRLICGDFEQGQGFSTDNSTRNNVKGLRRNIFKTGKEKKNKGKKLSFSGAKDKELTYEKNQQSPDLNPFILVSTHVIRNVHYNHNICSLWQQSSKMLAENVASSSKNLPFPAPGAARWPLLVAPRHSFSVTGGSGMPPPDRCGFPASWNVETGPKLGHSSWTGRPWERQASKLSKTALKPMSPKRTSLLKMPPDFSSTKRNKRQGHC